MSALDLTNTCELPTPMGLFHMIDTGDEALRMVCVGDVWRQGPRPLVRMHSSCLASEVFDALDCDCADQLRESMKRMANEGRGLVFHLHQEGRGQGLSLKIRAVGLMQQQGLDTAEAFEALGLEQDVRVYHPVVAVLRRLGIDHVQLISNNPRKIEFLERHGIRVDRVPTHPTLRAENVDYLATKRDKLQHSLVLDTPDSSDAPIRFYHSDQPWGELSNFSRHAVFLKGRIWATTEHYYQAQKFAGTELEERVRVSPTPTEAKRLAHAWSDERRPGWSQRKHRVMLEALQAKFGQHPDLAARLVSSGRRELVEHTEHDDHWGDGGDGSGTNMLGRLLMRVRDELRSQLLPMSEAR
jgi:GTP cyclohydrolase II